MPGRLIVKAKTQYVFTKDVPEEFLESVYPSEGASQSLLKTTKTKDAKLQRRANIIVKSKFLENQKISNPQSSDDVGSIYNKNYFKLPQQPALSMFSPIIEDELDKRSVSTVSKPTTRGSIRDR